MKNKVYEYLRTIPKGKVVTYGQIAEYLGNKKFVRIVGNILHVNPDPIKYPCYKVVNSKGLNNTEIYLSDELPQVNKTSGKFNHIYKDFL